MTVVDVGVGEEAAVTALVGDADRFEVAVVMAAVVAGAEATEVRDAVAEEVGAEQADAVGADVADGGYEKVVEDAAGPW